MKASISVFILITVLYNVIIAQESLINTNDLKAKEINFKKLISHLPELKDGYVYQENNKPAEVQKITRTDYLNFNMASVYDLKWNELSQRYIIGYFKKAEDLFVLLTVIIDYGEVDALNYAPELMLYTKHGEKISQLNLARNFNDFTNPNFIYQNQQFVRDYIRIDTLDFDPETGEELETVYLQKTHQFFNVSFNEDGFLIKNKENVLLKLHNINQTEFGYNGDIIYPNGSTYKGMFDLSATDYSHQIYNKEGEYKNLNGKVLKGVFCGDTNLCNYPNLFVDKQLIEKSLCFSKKELMNLKGFNASYNNQIYRVTSYDLTYAIKGKIYIAMFSGNEFTLNVKKIFLQADSNSKIWIDNIRVKTPEEHYQVLSSKYISVQ
jgi:hypothetical protein